MSPSSDDRFVQLEQHIRHSIRGQNHLIPHVIERVTIAESDLATPGRPKGSFIFLGPTGVGKTKLARLLSHNLYGGLEPITLDMAEFKAEDALVKFIGDHTGRLGRLGSILTRNRRGVILADEIEKARSEVWDVFLSILDAGRITCGVDQTFDLSNFYIVFTSNIGASDILRAKHLNFTQIEKHVLAQLTSAFRPEFLARIDATVVFRKLTYDVQVEIAEMQLRAELKHLSEKGHRIEFHPDVLTFLLQVGFDKYLGARPLQKAMERHVRYPVARAAHKGIKEGILRVRASKDALVLS